MEHGTYLLHSGPVPHLGNRLQTTIHSRGPMMAQGKGKVVIFTATATEEPRVSSKSKRRNMSKQGRWIAPATHTKHNVSVNEPHHSSGQTKVAVPKASKCPVLNAEFEGIQERYKTLASTGCSGQFCQAGRMVHTDEPRVGENRALKVVEQEAREFLEELRRENFFADDEAFCERLRAVMKEIRLGATNGMVREVKKKGRVGGNWTQTPAELEFGLRRAWRNSRKCIMRSHCEELKLCDFRSITTSAGMATELMKAVSEAFNNGNIQPTVFVFPPRKADSRGPMIWNHQILGFAGYEMEGGSVLGDPMNQDLTKAIIELGWNPPTQKSRWDILPIVTMADGDVPVFVEIPPDIRKIVEIRHPRYQDEFEKLDLKWVAFPALTRLGFDIGGVQYTATPFIGWFMDAEIGVRNLADTFRYNALPEIAQALGLANDKIGIIAETFEELPEYERLAMLSRAQSELNYAVHWSFSEAKVNMSDSLTASMKWARYDDEFREKNGFRLPADPYWLAPPQGSIIPLWHRGGAPNYQPKPMICKHVQDPVKAWSREKPDWFISAKELSIVANLRPTRPKLGWRSSSFDSSYLQRQQTVPSDILTFVNEKASETVIEVIEVLPEPADRVVEIYYCSAGTLAEKIAAKLHDRVKPMIADISAVSLSKTIRPLNNMQISDMVPEKIFLFVISSTGQGEIPANGIKILEVCQALVAQGQDNIPFQYAMYGNGDTRYSGTYNGAAKKIQQQLRRVGGRPLAGGLFHGDTAVQATAFQAINPWWTKLQPALKHAGENASRLGRTRSEDFVHDRHRGLDSAFREEQLQNFQHHLQQIGTNYHDACLTSSSQQIRRDHPGSYLLTLDVKRQTYDDLWCIQVLPVNAPVKVRRALRALDVSASTVVPIDTNIDRCPTYARFFAEFVDLEAPFLDLQWLSNINGLNEVDLDNDSLNSLSVIETLGMLRSKGLLVQLLEPCDQTPTLRLDICLAMSLLHTRNYSIASSQSYNPQIQNSARPKLPAQLQTRADLQILVKSHPTGRFSNTFLADHPGPAPLKYRLVDSICGPALRAHSEKPLIIVATGAGFAPVRCLLQRRIVQGSNGSGKISLFLGLKLADIPLVTDVIMEAASVGVLERMHIVPSNEEKVRVYDRLKEEEEVVRRMLAEEGGRVFVCAGPECAKEVKRVIREVVGGDAATALGERYIEEVF